MTGPIAVTADSYPFLATDIDLSRWGYVEQEFFISGNGYRYDMSGAVDQVANRIETGGPNGNGTYPFQTRIVVRRPANPADANGTVIAEWNNVTASRDIEWNWFGDPEFLLRNGYTFVGVTAQNVGIAGLRAFDSERYGDLEGRWDTSMPINLLGQNDPTLDDLSFDIYGAALKAVRGAGTGPDPLGGIEVETVIASGESQSCGRLDTHYTVTDRRLIVRHGILNRNERSASLERIQNVNTGQGLLGRLLNFGDVEFDTAGSEVGDAELALRGVNDPHMVRDDLDRILIGRSAPQPGL